MTDVAVITAGFGNDPTRTDANSRGICMQLKQEFDYDYYLIEAHNEPGCSAYPKSLRERLNHVEVPLTPSSQDLFQKESLMNFGWKFALRKQNYDYFIFTDADIYSSRLDWFKLIRARLQEDPGRAVQGYRIVLDSKDPRIHYASLASAYVLNEQIGLPLNPGLCWGLHRSVLEAGHGFNAQCIDCAGDSIFVAEFINFSNHQYFPWINQYGWFHEIKRDIPFRLELDCVPIDIVHVHHGYLRERNYDGVFYALDGFPPFRELVARNQHGLLYWKDPGCTERALLKHRHRMASKDEVDRLFDEFDYTRTRREQIVDRIDPLRKPLFVSSDCRRGSSITTPDSAPDSTYRKRPVMNIFNMVNAFRDEFPYSWGEGIHKLADSHHIPIDRERDPIVLVLDGLEATNHILGTMPIQPSFEPCDLSGFSTLNFTVWASKKMSSDIIIKLMSTGQDGTILSSRQISLVANGFRHEECQAFSLPLAAFENSNGFQLSHTSQLTFEGLNSFRMELSKIYIT